MRNTARDVARSVIFASVCVLVTQLCCAKQLNRSRYSLGNNLSWSKEQ